MCIRDSMWIDKNYFHLPKNVPFLEMCMCALVCKNQVYQLGEGMCLSESACKQYKITEKIFINYAVNKTVIK